VNAQHIKAVPDRKADIKDKVIASYAQPWLKPLMEQHIAKGHFFEKGGGHQCAILAVWNK
jgi:hypothetical protein